MVFWRRPPFGIVPTARLQMAQSGNEGFDPYTKASVFEKLSSLVSEIEQSVKYESPEQPAAIDEALAQIRQRSYLERAPEAQHATLLFRHYSSIVNRKANGQGSTNGVKTDGFWDPDLTRDILPADAFEGRAEVLVGMEATRSNAFILRAIISVLSFLAFAILCSCKYIHNAELTPEEMFADTPTCYMRAAEYLPYSGNFNMVPYQWLIAVSFFVFLHSAGFCAFYILPKNPDTDHKYIPGCGEWMERCLLKVGREDVSYGTRTAAQRVSDFCHARSKMLEWSIDTVLLIFTLMFCIVVSIDVERGAEFTFGNHPPQWYTLGTWHLTFQGVSPSCVGGADPSNFIRWGLAFLYIGAFFQALSLKVSRDSFLKYEKGKQLSHGPLAMNAPDGNNMDRRGLMRSTGDADADDEEIPVDL